MAHPVEKRVIVRAAYVYQRQPLPVAAAAAEVSLGAARRWKAEAEHAGDDWDKARSVASLADTGRATIVQGVINDYLVLHQATVEALKEDKDVSALERAEALSRLADAFTKIMTAAGKASPEMGRLAVATDVIKRLSDYVGAHAPKLAGDFLELLEPFAAELARAYG